VRDTTAISLAVSSNRWQQYGGMGKENSKGETPGQLKHKMEELTLDVQCDRFTINDNGNDNVMIVESENMPLED